MVEKFNKLKLCIAKTLIDLGLSANIEYRFSQHEFDALVNLENILKPVKLAVEVLCRQDATLITAEATLKFMIKKLEDNNSALASELALFAPPDFTTTNKFECTFDVPSKSV
ncbi:hypothetical protein EVAR_21762_1 [Eumeta japonica]|uniref:Uncharacterized protein n=1 Tax=Eumeta variegata TaxID=151549 RepID=A0A4C1ZNA7_EUMVA|nr:hypothetical protein EVAR_21762_1 [Eumeta japonica]